MLLDGIKQPSSRNLNEIIFHRSAKKSLDAALYAWVLALPVSGTIKDFDAFDELQERFEIGRGQYETRLPVLLAQPERLRAAGGGNIAKDHRRVGGKHVLLRPHRVVPRCRLDQVEAMNQFRLRPSLRVTILRTVPARLQSQPFGCVQPSQICAELST